MHLTRKLKIPYFLEVICVSFVNNTKFKVLNDTPVWYRFKLATALGSSHDKHIMCTYCMCNMLAKNRKLTYMFDTLIDCIYNVQTWSILVYLQ